MNTDLLV